MRELIIKVDDPGERAWDGSSKVFEIKELVRCKDCINNLEGRCDNLDLWVESYPEWFCADGKIKEG